MRLIDLFAGVGGIRLGFENLTKDCVFSSEIDKYAFKTYKANFGEFPHGDITKIASENVPKHDILVAGFPCQPFSIAGRKEGFADTRGTLFFHIARILAFHKPQVVFLENVKGLVSHDKGKTLAVILRTLTDLGYFTKYQVLKAKDFGVPQNRPRIYIVGFRDEEVAKSFEFPAPTNKPTRVGDILEDSVADKYTLKNGTWEYHQKRTEISYARHTGFRFSSLTEESPFTRTITSRYHKDGQEALLLQKDKNPRKLTPREIARLQGFPDSFILPCSDTQSYRQLGNAVCVTVVSTIVEKIKQSLT